VQQDRIVFTLAASDRRKLVGDIAGVIRAHGGSWVDSALSRLGGAIAGIIVVDVPSAAKDGLLAALASFAGDGIQLAPVKAKAPPDPVNGRRARLMLACVDRPGIIEDLARALAATGAIFETLETATDFGSMSGEMMFTAKALVWMPDGLDGRSLSEACESLSPDLMADIDLLPERSRPSVPA
jgi:glycine cleavage system regulatory protein